MFVFALMEEYNHSMNSIRISVGWIFGDIINYFKLVCRFKKKIALSSVRKMYIVAALLCNAYTCLYGDTTSEFFFFDQLPPPIQGHPVSRFVCGER